MVILLLTLCYLQFAIAVVDQQSGKTASNADLNAQPFNKISASKTKPDIFKKLFAKQRKKCNPSETLQPSSNPTETSVPTATSIPSSNPVSASEASLNQTPNPSLYPSTNPSLYPSTNPSLYPSSHPSLYPSTHPSLHPITSIPSSNPTSTSKPSSSNLTPNPSLYPSTNPSIHPSSRPSLYPSTRPSLHPSTRPSLHPSTRPSLHPSTRPSLHPSTHPSLHPSTHPSSTLVTNFQVEYDLSLSGYDIEHLLENPPLKSKFESMMKDILNDMYEGTYFHSFVIGYKYGKKGSNTSGTGNGECTGNKCNLPPETQFPNGKTVSMFTFKKRKSTEVMFEELQNTAFKLPSLEYNLLSQEVASTSLQYRVEFEQKIETPWSSLSSIYLKTIDETDYQSVSCLQDQIECEHQRSNITSIFNDMRIQYDINTHECSWSGVVCNADNVITQFRIENKNEKMKPFPEACANLHSLTILILNNNYITGTLPGELGGLKFIKTLSLENNKITGSIPSELGLLYSMKELKLNSNQFSGRIPEELSDAESLEILDISRNYLGGPIDPSIGKLRNLRTLILYNSGVVEAIPESFRSLRDLEEVILEGNRLTGTIDVFSKLPRLKVLDLANNNFRGTIPLSFRYLNALNVLNLYGNDFDGNFPKFVDRFPSLRELILAKNNFMGYIPSEIGTLSNLEIFDVADNDLYSRLPTEMGNLLNLRTLNCHGNEIYGTIPSELRLLTRLTDLILSQNKLRGIIPHGLGQNSNLTQLDVGHNALEGHVPTTLNNLMKIKKLYIWHNNNLSGNVHFLCDINYVEGSTFKFDRQNFRCGEDQKTAMERIYSGLKENYYEIDPVCEWVGVICNSYGAVIEIKLDGRDLDGSISSFIGEIHNLEKLDLNGNSLIGNVPQELDKLQLLKYVNFSNNELIGNVLFWCGASFELILENVNIDRCTTHPSTSPTNFPSLLPSSSPSSSPSSTPSLHPTLHCEYICNDNNPCTKDKCKVLGEGCEHERIDGCINGALYEIWLHIHSESTVEYFSKQPNFPDFPYQSTVLTNAMQTAENQADNYGSRLRTYIYPPFTGEYTFFLACDNGGNLLLSHNTDPAFAQRIAYISAYGKADHPNQWYKYLTQRSPVISLVKGTPYYLEVQHIDGVGNDFVTVAWESPENDMSVEVIDAKYTTTVPNPCVYRNVALAKYEGVVASQINTEGNSFADIALDGNTVVGVTHTKTVNHPWWQVELDRKYYISRVDVYNRKDCCAGRIEGFVLSIYNGGTIVESRSGRGIKSTYVFNFSNIYGDKVKIIIPADNKILSLTEVQVLGRVDQSDAEACWLTCYDNDYCDDGDPCTVDKCTNDGLCEHEIIDGCINGVIYEVWKNIRHDFAYRLSYLTGFHKYPDSPDETSVRTKFEGPVNPSYINYGSRLRSYIFPPVTGSYTFYITSRSEGKLYLSLNTNQAAKKQIAYCSYNVYPYNNREWQRNSAQRSSGQWLERGKAYYIEAVQVGTQYTRFVSVGWKIPGSTSIAVIESEYCAHGNIDPDVVLSTNPSASGSPSASPSLNSSASPSLNPRNSTQPYFSPSSYPTMPPV